MIIINSAMAHMDERNWNLGPRGEEHPVTSFWAQRFLTAKSSRASLSRSPEPSIDRGSDTKSDESTDSNDRASPSSVNADDRAEEEEQHPRFSLDHYKGTWIPFGGGIHQCPRRHWVKTQMLPSFVMITAAFEIELLDNDSREELKVDMAKYGLGALQPGKRVGFRIRRKRGTV